jgi:sugar-specific transcriptional regulator TrmB
MKSIDVLLGEAGLSKNASAVYLYLLRSGERAGTEIYSDTQMDKSSCYRAIKELVELGLVSTNGETRNQTFCAYSPNRLIDIVRIEQDRLVETKHELELFSKSMDSYISESYKSKNVTVLEGPSGYLRYMEARLEKPGSIIRDITTIESELGHHEDYLTWIQGHIKERVKRKISIRVLYGSTDTIVPVNTTIPNELKEARQLPSPLSIRANISTFASTMGIYRQTGKDFLGILIRDPIVTEMQNSIYDYLWNQGKPIYPTKGTSL